MNGRHVPLDLGIIGSIVDGRYEERKNAVLKKEIDIKDYGQFALCDKVGKDILNELKKVYNENIATTIYVMALLRTVYGDVTDKEIEYRYYTSFASRLTRLNYPNL